MFDVYSWNLYNIYIFGALLNNHLRFSNSFRSIEIKGFVCFIVQKFLMWWKYNLMELNLSWCTNLQTWALSRIFVIHVIVLEEQSKLTAFRTMQYACDIFLESSRETFIATPSSITSFFQFPLLCYHYARRVKPE